METKLYYEAPATAVTELSCEGWVCVSQTDYTYGDLDE
jgi:hypothetical protein